MNSATALRKSLLPITVSVRTGPHAGESFVLEKLPFTIGRGAENDIILPNDPKLSRSHIRISPGTRDSLAVENLSLRNPLLYKQRNEQKIELTPTESIRIGDSEIQFAWDGPVGDQTLQASPETLAKIYEEKTVVLASSKASSSPPQPKGIHPATQKTTPPPTPANALGGPISENTPPYAGAPLIAPVGFQNPSAPPNLTDLPIIPQPASSDAIAGVGRGSLKPVTGSAGSVQSPYGTAVPSPYGAAAPSPYGVATPSPYGAAAPSPYGAATRPSKNPSKSSGAGRPQKQSSGFLLPLIVVIGIVGLLMVITKEPPKPAKPRPIMDSEQIAMELEKSAQSVTEHSLSKRLDEEGRMDKQFESAQSYYLKGFRDYRLGQYARAIISFQAALSFDPNHVLARKYLNQSLTKHAELIQFNLDQARRYRLKNNFRLCRSSAQQVMVLRKDQNDSQYKDAKRLFDECDTLSKGRF